MFAAIPNFYKKARALLYGKRARLLIGEAWPLLIVVSALTFELSHIATSIWRQLLFYNSDSLTLPLIRQSLAHHEAFHWVFSSQFYLFPEGIIYAFCSLVTTSIRASLVLNAYINVVILYILLRAVVWAISKRDRVLQIIFSLGLCLLFILYMVLERQPTANALATYFLFTSYYYGVIMAGLAVLFASFLQLNKPGLKTTSGFNKLLSVLVIIVSGLATFSDPLFIVQFALPFLITLGLLYLINTVDFRRTLQVGAPQVVGVLLGFLSRGLLKDHIGESLGTYINVQAIPQTLTTFHGAISIALQSKSGKLEVTLITGVILCALVSSLYLIHEQSKRTVHNKRLLLFCTTFGWISPAVLIFIVVLGGGQVRYLIPIALFPLVGLLCILESSISIKQRRFWMSLMVVAALFILALLIPSVKGASKLVSSQGFSSTSCLADALDNKPANGVGGYWDVRSIDVFASDNETVLQADSNFTIFPWLINLSSYQNKKFSFVIVDKPLFNVRSISPADAAVLGQPTIIHSCSSFFVYTYEPDSLGYRLLNNQIDTSLRKDLKLMNTGQIAKYIMTTQV